jgi:glycine/D-amino acid oxidase-like deaminating enzyme
MRRLSLGRKTSGLRARRWDAIVLGGALPGLVAAARMGQRGHRVLVVEEESAARLPASVRDPFFLGPPGGDGVVDACLAALKIGLRDRRRIEADGITYQMVSQDARIDVGSPLHTARELVSWGVAKPEQARDIVRNLAEAAQGQLAALLDAPLVRRSGLRGLSRTRPSGASEPRRSDLPDLRFLEDPALQSFFLPCLEAAASRAARSRSGASCDGASKSCMGSSGRCGGSSWSSSTRTPGSRCLPAARSGSGVCWS